MNDLIIKEVIGDGSCFFHAVLLAIDNQYQNSDILTQIKICADLRNKIATLLQQKDVAHDGYYYWETINRLEFLSALLLADNDISYEPQQLSNYFANHHAPVGDEAYVFIPYFYDCNLVIVAIDSNNTYGYNKYYQSNWLENKDIITVLYTPGHYRLLCSKQANTWSSEDAFIQSLQLEKTTHTHNISMQQEYINFVNTFVVNGTLDLTNFSNLQQLAPYHYIIRHILQACQHLTNVTIIGNLTGNRMLERNILSNVSDEQINEYYQLVDAEKNYYYRNLLHILHQQNIEAYNLLVTYYL